MRAHHQKRFAERARICRTGRTRPPWCDALVRHIFLFHRSEEHTFALHDALPILYEECARIIKNALPSVLAFVEQGELVRPGATRSSDISSYSIDRKSTPLPYTTLFRSCMRNARASSKTLCRACSHL